MKKVLILAYDFPPYVSVGGLRPYAWYRYFKEFDIYPIVVTRQWENKYCNHLDYIAPSETTQAIIETTEHGTIIKTPYVPNLANKLMLKYGEDKYKFIRKFISAYYELLQWVFLIGSKSELYFAAKKYLKSNNVDFIIATGEPFILFKYASMLSGKFNTPWIADYRDPWSQSIFLQKKHILKLWNSYFEKKIVKSSTTIITVSEFFKFQISNLIKNKQFYIFPNGYDPENIANAEKISQQNIFLKIAFIGTVYQWHPIRSFLVVMMRFIEKNPTAKIEFNIYGVNIISELQKIISSEFKSISENICIYSKMANNVLLQNLASNNIMLLFNDYSIIGTKIYDCIGIKRLIILCYTNDKEAIELKEKYYTIKEEKELSHHLQEDLIKETNSGIVVKDSAHLLKVLSDLNKEFKTNGFIACNSVNIENYSRKIQVQKLAEIIKQYYHSCPVCNSKIFRSIDYFKYSKLYKCKSCNYVFGRKMPSEKELIECYLDYGKNNYFSPITEKRYNELFDYFEKFKKTNKILDIGCGEGWFLLTAKKRGWDVYGTEYSETLIKSCIENGLNVIKGENILEKLEHEIFDIITSFEVIEHLIMPEKMIKEISILLRSGGLTYITTPNFSSISKVISGKNWSVVQYPEHLVYFTPKTLTQLFERNGFIKEKIITSGISISRFELSKKGSTEYKTQIDSSDEMLRRLFEASVITIFFKTLINYMLTMFKKGDTIKAFYIKKSS